MASWVEIPGVRPSQIPLSLGSPPWDIEIREMLESQPDQNVFPFRRERISVSPQFLAASGLAIGQQVIVRIPGYDFKAMTIGHTHTEEDPRVVRMNAAAYEVWEHPVQTVAATLEGGVIPSDVDEATAEAQGLIIEARSAIPTTKQVMVIANHGGMVEPWTHTQAIRSQARLSAASIGAAYYVVQGYKPPSGSETRITSWFWHITSADFRGDRGSWPKLAEIWDERFDWAISYHGMGGEKHIGVGGLADAAVLSGAIAAIQAVVPGDYLVDTIETSHLDGTSERNIMNRFAAPLYRTIQLEQTFDARRDYHEQIADALVDYLMSLL